MNRYHVHLGDKRTTVSLGDTLSHLLALKLGAEPETEKAHTAIRKLLQARLDGWGDPGRTRVSQWLQDYAIEFIADKKLSEKYSEWILKDL